MRKALFLSLLAVVLCLVASPARADLITLNPTAPYTWDVVVGPLPANTAVGGYDIDIAFDPLLLQFTNATPGIMLGAPLFSFFNAFTTGGVLTLQEVSLLPAAELVGFQPATFVLASIEFAPLVLGTDAGLHLLDATVDLADQFGNPIIEGQIPEPGTMLLLGSGLAALARWRKKLI